jgi:polysaccharide chain length determinant protein (PEP-CTERM system associated)
MLPGKTFKPADAFDILRRRYWMLLVPFAIVSAGTAIIARRLPVLYQSQAVIQVVPQRVPENYVKATVTTRIEDRLESIKQQILSRTRLEQVIQEFNLYPDARRVDIMENVVDRMRTAVRVEVNKSGDSFTVSYRGSDPTVVTKVTASLAAQFVDESLHDREQLYEGTDQFLESQLQDARRRLEDQEQKLAAYRMKYAGQLPTQEGANLQALAGNQMQLQQLADADNRDTDRRLMLERALKDLELEKDTPVEPTASTTAPSTPDAAPLGNVQTLDAAKKGLAQLRQRYSDNWPDVQALKRYVDDLQKKVDAEALQQPLTAPATSDSAAAASPAVARQTKIRGLQADLKEIDRQMAARQLDEKRLKDNAVVLQQRVDAVPARESEMTELTRDYATLSGLYTSLLAKKEDSKLASNLERRQIGEQFKLIDPARVPEKPVSPDRPSINMYGMTVGLALGLGMIVLLEYRDSTFKNDGEIRDLLELPVLAIVPIMQSESDRRRARARRVVIDIGLGSAVAGCLAVLAYTFVR